MKKIQARARKIKRGKPNMKHTTAVKQAAKELRAEGVFKGPKKKKTRRRRVGRPRKR